MKPSSAKSKGREGQKRLVRLILRAFGDRLASTDARSVSMGAGGADILLSAAALRLLPLAIESKCTEKASLASAWRQAVAHTAADHGGVAVYPVVVFAGRARAPVAVMDAVHWGEFTRCAPVRRARPDAMTKAEAASIDKALDVLRAGAGCARACRLYVPRGRARATLPGEFVLARFSNLLAVRRLHLSANGVL